MADVTIHNEAMKGEALRLRSGRTVKGDALGTFSVPKADAELLLTTPGWHAGEGPKPPPTPMTTEEAQAAEIADLREELAMLRAGGKGDLAKQLREVTAERDAALAKVTELEALIADGGPDPVLQPSQPEGPDLDSMNKEQLIALALEHGVPVASKSTKDEIKAALDKALFGGDGG